MVVGISLKLLGSGRAPLQPWLLLLPPLMDTCCCIEAPDTVTWDPCIWAEKRACWVDIESKSIVEGLWCSCCVSTSTGAPLRGGNACMLAENESWNDVEGPLEKPDPKGFIIWPCKDEGTI